ncbi:MAG: DUF4411 family protein [Chloroflexota bacterium]|nr:DUF4411 family protein [Chloroflexota bacterium]MDE2961510.1 DUF4411 family protein [Chloroflexota bacterium]
MDRVPEFWDWLAAMGQRGLVKAPREVYDKVTQADDALSRWLKRNREALLLAEMINGDLIRRVIDEGYAPDLTDVEIEQLNEDPFLVAYALADPEQRRVVSTERSRPSARRANRRIPDVCRDFGIPCHDTFRFIRELDFRTDWRAQQ